ncbi:CwfJ C-terminus 1-domain-containing protein-like protein [Tribonema minus]|uniref:CwfJ C-terminus 1-domain-containing protein-like protein n=1 Tax=Tribonema minus TaxID=303371 RepID=A0A836CIX0_9STRA|nr:CwfJ C-terminus 1-domain-containing protein-like protein [Tribonema minus]
MCEDLRSNPRKKGKVKESRESAREGEGLEEFLRRERAQGERNMDEDFVNNVLRLGARYKGTELGGKKRGGGAGEDEEEDVDMKMFQSRDDRLTDVAAAERAQQAAITQHKAQTAALSQCKLCPGSKAFASRLMVANGQHVYLQLVVGSGLSQQHCLIVPMKHTQAATTCEEDVWAEIDTFKAAMRAMAKARGNGILFMETALGFSKRPHASIDAVPVPLEVEQDAPLYFKQALLEAADEWATHKKVITVPASGGIRRAVPRNFAYFAVEWGGGGGYAHVIEQEDRFPADFGRGVVAGMMGVDPPRFNRKGQGASAAEEQKLVDAFQKHWAPYDWTSA